MKQTTSNSLTQTVAILAILATIGLLTACAAPGPIKYKLECRSNIDYDGCNEVYDDEASCEDVRNQMMRDLPGYDRGTCLRQ